MFLKALVKCASYKPQVEVFQKLIQVFRGKLFTKGMPLWGSSVPKVRIQHAFSMPEDEA